VTRGLRLDGRVLCVIDGGKGLRKAVDDVLGTGAVIQRGQLHKQRNLLALIPQRASRSCERRCVGRIGRRARRPPAVSCRS
jgi:transposase-like protein